MSPILSTKKLVPLIDVLSRNLSDIAAVLMEDAINAAKAESAAKESTKTLSEPKNKEVTEKPKDTKTSENAGSSKKTDKKVTIEQVRAILAEKSQAGLTAKVKDLLITFGAEKLSGIDPEHYEDLIEAAKELQ